MAPKRGLGRLLSGVSLRHRAAGYLSGEDGSVTAFSLFIFLMMLFVGGMAVDLMRFETRRAALQNTIDASTLAAASIRSDADAEQLVRDFMDKRGYNGAAAQINVQEVRSGADPTTGDPGILAARSVSASYDLDMNTIFMPLLGIETLGTAAGGGAKEGQTSVEISLVVDISNSMNSEGRLTDLKTAAKNFIDLVIDPTRADLPVTVSIVPFNHTVVAPDEILDQLDTHGMINIPSQQVVNKPGALTEYDRSAPESRCVRFHHDEMVTDNLQANLSPAQNPNYRKLRSISTSDQLDMMGYYALYYGGAGYSNLSTPPNDVYWRCNPDYYPAILPWGSDATALKSYIDAMVAHGNTSADTGLKWGMAMLDPEFRSLVSTMVNDGDLPAELDGRPYDYNPANFMKVIVLMTDGANTVQHDIAPEFQNGPSTVWYSAKAAHEIDPATGADWSNEYVVDNKDASGNQGSDGNKDRNKTWYDGYYVQRTDGSGNERWFRGHNPHDFDDGVLLNNGQLPDDAVQLTWAEVFERFSLGHAGLMHYDSTLGSYQSWYNLYYGDRKVIDNLSDGKADWRMVGDSNAGERGLCDAAKVNNDVLVYTIAFKAGTDAETIMKECATSLGYYFKASDGASLNQAFSSIAASVTTLRLTQ